MKKNNELYQAGLLLHGHTCPAMPMGLRAGLAALEALGVERAVDGQLTALVEIDRDHCATCYADGVQMATGCTFGKGNIEKLGYGKFALTLIENKTGRRVRVVTRPETIRRNQESAFIQQRKQGVPASHIEAPVVELLVEEVLSAPTEALFTVEPVQVSAPPTARPHDFNTVICAECGEVLVERYARVKAGQIVCIPCAEKSKSRGNVCVSPARDSLSLGIGSSRSVPSNETQRSQPMKRTLREDPGDGPPSQAPSMQSTEQAFRQAYPAFEQTSILDHLRATEYTRLDELEHIYLDHTGGGLYADSQLREHVELLRHHVFGNPHSQSLTSKAMTELDEHARTFVLDFFRASPDEYTVIFTANATHALKLVGEAYPFRSGSQFLLLADNHNSVNGIREFARAKGTSITYLPVISPELRGDTALLLSFLEQSKNDADRLFAYPAQSNFTGVQHPLEWIAEAHLRGWDVLLDAAAFVPTNRLDLSRWHPDFVPISFYKMFGYPTGVGCLLARKAALAKLKRPWFAGGTVWGSSVQGDGYVLLDGGEAFEDGTLNYLSLPAVEIGLKHLMAIGMETIHERVWCLTDWLLEELLSLHHRNGIPLVQLYGPPTTHQRGGTMALNFLDPHGAIIDERVVEQRAEAFHLSLRTGCFCNPGAGEAAFHLSQETLRKLFHEQAKDTLPTLFQEQGKMSWDAFLADLGMQSGGAIRISLGLVSNFADVYRLVQCARSFLDTFPVVNDMLPRHHC